MTYCFGNPLNTNQIAQQLIGQLLAAYFIIKLEGASHRLHLTSPSLYHSFIYSHTPLILSTEQSTDNPKHNHFLCIFHHFTVHLGLKA